jgi:hypothetical protein
MWFVTFSTGDPKNPSAIAFEASSGDWLDVALLDKNRMYKYRVGRIGTAFVLMGVYVILTGAMMFVPNWMKEMAEDDDRQEEAETADVFMDDDDEEANKVPQSRFWTPMLWKRAHMIWSTYVLLFALLCVWEFSYSSQFEDNVYMWIVAFKIVQMLMDQILAGLLKEQLLIAPLMVVIEISEILITLGASDFMDFTLSYFVELAVMIMERLYLDPLLKETGKLLPRWRMMLKRRFATKRRMTREQKAKEEAEWRRINEEIELESEGVEPLLDSYSVYSNEATALVLFPWVNLFLIYFNKETEMPDNYGIKETDLVYYLMFAIVMVPSTFLMDVWLLNTQELAHGWKLYDYVSYQKYRFSVREYRWQMRCETLDESIAEPLQTLDLLCFSSQYYFMCTFHAWGMLVTMFGVTIMLRTQYHMLGDPELIKIFAIIFLIGNLIQRLMRKLADLMRLWMRKSLEGTVDDDVAAKLAIGEGRQEDLEQERLELQAMNSERFRHRFLERSRPWILQHLVELLTPRTLQMPGPDGRPEIEYVRDVYNELMNMGEGKRRPGDRSDISSDDEDELEKQRRDWPRAPVTGAALEIIQMWLARARKRKVFHALVAGIIENACDNVCFLCGRTEASGAKMSCDIANEKGMEADPHALDAIIAAFEAEYGPDESNPDLWQSFFRSHATFITRCEHCIDQLEKMRLQKLVRHPGESRATRAGDISTDEEDEEEVFDPMMVARSSSEGRMMSKWLTAARTRLGGAFPRPHARDEMESYVKKMRARKEKGGKKRPKGAPDYDEEEEEKMKTWVVRLNAASKALMQKWVKKARDIIVEKEGEKALDLRRQMKNLLEKLKEEDDWYYGTELRLAGGVLCADGDTLIEDRRSLEAEQAVKTRKIDDDLRKFTDDKQLVIDEKRATFETQYEEEKAAVADSADKRVQELTQLRKEKEVEFAQEEKLARERDGAPSSKLMTEHRTVLKEMDDMRAAERDRMLRVQEEKERKAREEFDAEELIALSAIANRRGLAEDRIAVIKKETRNKLKLPEQSWQRQANAWLDKTGRKNAMKEKEDAEHAAQQKRKHGKH